MEADVPRLHNSRMSTRLKEDITSTDAEKKINNTVNAESIHHPAFYSYFSLIHYEKMCFLKLITHVHVFTAFLMKLKIKLRCILGHPSYASTA